jgi:hypothetical protein
MLQFAWVAIAFGLGPEYAALDPRALEQGRRWRCDNGTVLLTMSGTLRSCPQQKLMGVEAFLAHHHAGDVGPPPAWGGIADDGPDAPCAVAGMFGCAPMNSTYDYWKNGVPWEGPPVVFH